MSNRNERIAALIFEARQRGFAEVDKALVRTSAVAVDSYEAISRESRRVLKDTERFIEDIDDATASAQRLNKELKNTGFLSGDLKGKLGTIRTENRAESFATSTIANILPGNLGNASRELFDLLDTIPDLGTAFKVLGASVKDTLEVLGGGSAGAGVGVVAALGVVALATASFTNTMNEAYEATQKRTAAEQAYIDLVDKATTKSLLAQKTVVENEIAKQGDKLDIAKNKLNDLLTQVNTSVDKLPNGVSVASIIANLFADSDVGKALGIETGGLFGGALKGAADDVDAAQKALDELGISLDNINLALSGDPDVAINDMADGFQRFLDEANALSKMQLDTDIQAQVSAMSASSEAIKKQIAAMTLERDERQKAIDQQLVSGDVLKEYQNKVSELNASIASQGNQLPAVILRELQEAYKEHGDKIITIDDELFEKQADARKTREDALTEAILKAGDEQVEHERKAGIDRGEAQRKADLDYEKEQERHEKAIAKIQRDFNSARTSAIQDRDVVALQAAKDARKQALLDENDANKERKDAISDALKEQNRQIDKSLAEQNRTVNRRLEQQKQTIESRYNDQLSTAQSAADKALAIETKRYNDILLATQTGSDAILAAWKNLVAQVATNSAATNPQAAPVPSAPQTQSARALLDNAPLTPFPAAPSGLNTRGGNFGASSRGGAGNQIIIPIHLNGMTQRELVAKTRDEVHRRLDYILRENGY